jgi:hypothetical protein
MRSFLLNAAVGVIALSLLLAESPGLQACPPTAWVPIYGGYAYGWYYPAYPVYSGGYYPAYASDRQVPGGTQTRAYYYEPQTSEPVTPQGRVPYSVPAPSAPPAYSGYYTPNPSQSSSAGVDNSPIFDRWKPDLSDPFNFRGDR